MVGLEWYPCCRLKHNFVHIVYVFVMAIFLCFVMYNYLQQVNVSLILDKCSLLN